MIDVERPAGLHHLIKTLSDNATMPPQYWHCWLIQIQKSETAAFFDNDELLAVCGLYPLADDVLALWFATTPRAKKKLIGLARCFRLTLARACESRSVTVRSFVASGWRPTARLLRLIGFQHAGHVKGYEIFDLKFGG